LVPFVVAHYAKCSDAYKAEAEIHSLLARYRITDNREFFRLDIREAVAIVDDVCARFQSLQACHTAINQEEREQREDQLVAEATSLLFREGKLWPSMVAGHLAISLNEAEYILNLLRGRGMIDAEWEVTGYAAVEYQNRKDRERRMKWKKEREEQDALEQSISRPSGVPTFSELTANDHLPYSGANITTPPMTTSISNTEMLRSGTAAIIRSPRRWSNIVAIFMMLGLLVVALKVKPILGVILILPAIIVIWDRVREMR
jgi:hypothetical protein